jgi:hypothetical protein
MQGDAQRHMDTLHMAAKHISGELGAVVKALLGKATREAMLAWLGAVIEGNGERAKMQMDLRVRGAATVWARSVLESVVVEAHTFWSFRLCASEWIQCLVLCVHTCLTYTVLIKAPLLLLLLHAGTAAESRQPRLLCQP